MISLLNQLPLVVFFIILAGNVAMADKSSHNNGDRKSFRRLKSNRLGRRASNILFIMTDDQDVQLGSMEFMPKTLRIMRNRGVEFTNAFVTTPICCPSRSSILTGMYVHNHNVHTNNENCTGPEWQAIHEPRTLGAYLSKTGYRTGYFGKYLNEYNGSYIPVGWHEWMGLIKNSKFYNYSVNFNGQKIKHGDNYYKDYFTDLIANDSLTFLKRSKRLFPRKPVLMFLSFPAPHGPEDPAPQHAGLFNGFTSHRTPAWNYAPNPDKQWLLQHTGKMEPVHVAFTDHLHRRRLQTLQSVDDAVHKVVSEFRDLRELSNTYVIYTSDHGYHLGQFGLIKGKNMPYEFDLKVPYFIRGPNVPKGLRVEEAVGNIDLTPTVLDMAALPVPPHMDGRSVLPLLHRNIVHGNEASTEKPWRDTLLVERGKMPKLAQIRQRFMMQRDRYSKELRIQKECLKHEYSAPCKPFQQWECRKNEVGRWRIFKCRGKISLVKDCACLNSETPMNASAMEDFVDIRAKRHATEEQEMKTYQIKEDTLYVDWEKRADNGESKIPESLISKWEDEFFNELIQREIVENDPWHQGIFDAVESVEDFDDDDDEIYESSDLNFDTEESSENVERIRRSIRENTGRRRRNRKSKSRTRQPRTQEEELFLQNKCIRHSNKTVSCSPEVYRDFEAWRKQKSTLDNRIRGLRTKLDSLKTIRRHLREGKPSDAEKEAGKTLNEESTQSFCSCMEQNVLSDQAEGALQSHPLKYKFEGFVSDAELLTYLQDRQSRKKGRGSRRRKKKGHRRIQSEKKKYCNIKNMNCFTHDSNHWKTPPLWPEQLGAFCFCQNSNNNTYWCLRTVNDTHNFLYCEFVTGFTSFYDIQKDPYQLNNAVYLLPVPVLEQLSAQLGLLKECQGWRECEKYSASLPMASEIHV